MLVDDHAIVRQGLTALLEREGFAIVGQAADGMQAIQLAKELRPEVVIVDFGMPILNGLGATRAIHEALPSGSTNVSGNFSRGTGEESSRFEAAVVPGGCAGSVEVDRMTRAAFPPSGQSR